jgi:hypothetical protein
MIERTDLSSTEYLKESGCDGCHHQILTAVTVRAAHAAGIRVDEGAARELLIRMKAELERHQELFLQGVDLFGSQLLVPYLFGLAEAGDAPDVITDSAVADLITRQSADGSWNRGPAISRPPIQGDNIARTAQAVRILRVYGPPARERKSKTGSRGLSSSCYARNTMTEPGTFAVARLRLCRISRADSRSGPTNGSQPRERRGHRSL